MYTNFLIMTAITFCAFLQISTPKGSDGHLPLFGILIGLIVGYIVGSFGSSGGKWSALAGAVLFALAAIANEASYSPATVMLAVEQALMGALWCGAWGFVGGFVGRKGNQRHKELISVPPSAYQPKYIQPPELLEGATVQTLDDELIVYQRSDLGSPVISRLSKGLNLRLGSKAEIDGREWFMTSLPNEITGYALAASVRSHTNIVSDLK